MSHIHTLSTYLSLQYQFSLIADVIGADIDGLVLAEQDTIAKSINQLLQMLGLSLVEQHDKIIITDNNNADTSDISTITTADLVWNEANKDYEMIRAADTDIANNVEFIYNNITTHGEIDVYNIHHPSHGFHNKVVYNNLGVFLDESKAHLYANRLLSEVWSNRLIAKFYLNISYAYLQVGSKIIFTISDDESYLLQITKIVFDRQRFYIEAMGYGQNFIANLANATTSDDADVAIAQATEIVILDISYRHDDINDVGKPQVLIATSANVNDEYWRYTTIYYQQEPLSISTNDATIADVTIVNSTNSLTIVVRAGDMGHLLADKQYLAAVNGEVISFSGIDVEFLSANKYLINNITRAVQQTALLSDDELLMATFVLLDGNIITHEVELDLIGEDITFRAVSNGLNYDNADDVVLNFAANNTRLLAVKNISYDNDTLLLSWQTIWRDGTIITDYSQHKYQLEIIDADDNSNIVEVVGANNYTISDDTFTTVIITEIDTVNNIFGIATSFKKLH